MNMAHQTASTFAEIIRAHAATRPNAPALTFENVTQTFAELDASSSRAANALRAEGIRPGDRVAVLTRNRTEFFELIITCSKIGAILVGLNWRLAAAEIAAILSDAEPALVIAGADEKALLPETSIRTIVFGNDYDAWRDAHPASDPGYRGGADEVILLLYTSGTTGLPKGVMLTNEGMSHTRRLADAWGMTSASVNLVAMPMFHIGGCGYGSSTMMAGGHTVLMREVDPAKAIELIARYRVTHTFFVPAVVQMLLQVPGIEDADLSSLELLMYGAAPIGDVLLKRAIGKLNCGFMHAYGMTEASGTVTILPPADHEPDGPPRGPAQILRQALALGRATRDRPCDADGCRHRDNRRGLATLAHDHEGLLEQPGRDPRGDRRGWLVSHRGRRLSRRGRLSLSGRPLQGHDHLRRREHLSGRDRKRAQCPSRCP